MKTTKLEQWEKDNYLRTIKLYESYSYLGKSKCRDCGSDADLHEYLVYTQKGDYSATFCRDCVKEKTEDYENAREILENDSEVENEE